jgi:hypothetical protein
LDSLRAVMIQDLIKKGGVLAEKHDIQGLLARRSAFLPRWEIGPIT